MRRDAWDQLSSGDTAFSALLVCGSVDGLEGLTRSSSEKNVDQRPCAPEITLFSPPAVKGLEISGVEFRRSASEAMYAVLLEGLSGFNL